MVRRKEERKSLREEMKKPLSITYSLRKEKELI